MGRTSARSGTSSPTTSSGRRARISSCSFSKSYPCSPSTAKCSYDLSSQPSTDTNPSEPQSTEDFQHHWDTFLKQVLERGNLLLGPSGFCRRTSHSWLLDWPKNSFKNTDIFRYP